KLIQDLLHGQPIDRKHLASFKCAARIGTVLKNIRAVTQHSHLKWKKWRRLKLNLELFRKPDRCMTALDLRYHRCKQSPEVQFGHRVVNSSISAIKRAIHLSFARVAINAPVCLFESMTHDSKVFLQQTCGDGLSQCSRRRP